MNDFSFGDPVRSANTKFSLRVPAVRPDFSNCRLYTASQVQAQMGLEPDGLAVILEYRIASETSNYLTSSRPPSYDNVTPDGYFAFLAHYSGQFNPPVWIWRHWNSSSLDRIELQLQSVSALGCNFTLQKVDTSITISGQTMLLDENDPPVPGYTSTVELPYDPLIFEIYAGPYTFWNGLSITTNTSFDSFFSVVTNSRYAVPIPHLGDDRKASAVADSIRFHHRVLIAQYVSRQWRFRNYEEAQNASGVQDLLPLTTNKSTIINAKAYDPAGHTRVVQDTASTRILQSLLAITFVCSGINWFLTRNMDVIPRSPTSIASVLALLADGNLNDFLPRNACHMSLDDVSRNCFGKDAMFSLKRRTCPDTGKEVLGIICTPGREETAGAEDATESRRQQTNETSRRSQD